MEENWNKQIRMLLKDAGLNPDDPTFIHDPAYMPFKNSYFLSTDEGRLTVDYYIWSKWISQTMKNKLKPGVFDIGVSKKPKILKKEMLYKEIADEEIADDEGVKQKLVGKSSIKSKLKDGLNFNLDKFGSDQEYDKLKLLKLFYWYEKSTLNNDKVNILSILSKPSITNQDQRLMGRESPYGKVLTELKFEVRKEVDELFAKRVVSDTATIMHAWDMIHFNVIHLVNRDIPISDITIELNRISDHIQCIFDYLNVVGCSENYENLVMESFYLKIHQLEQISRTRDLQKAIKHICSSEHTKKLKEMEGIYPLGFEDCLIFDAESYLKDNLERVTKLTYQREDVTKQEMTYILKKLERVQVLLSIYNNQRHSPIEQQLSLSFLIAALQEILLTEKPGFDDPEAYFANEYFKSKRTVRTLSSVIKNFEMNVSVEEEIYELICMTKIERRLYAFRGRLDQYLLSVGIGEQISKIIERVTSVPQLDMMNALHNYFLDQLFLTEKLTIGHYQEEFTNAVMANTGYDCIICSQRVFSMFDNTDRRLGFTHLIINAVNGQFDLSDWQRDGDYYMTNLFNHQIVVEINHEEQRFVLKRFMPMLSNEEVKLLQQYGLNELLITKD